jgi:prephenate dehydratase
VKTIIAFQGAHGAYSDEALRQHFTGAHTLPCEHFYSVFEAVLSEQAQHGLLPVENSIAGTVAQVYELLLDHDLRVQAEIIFRIEHMLLAAPGTRLQDIRRVKSHPQALSQCEGFIQRRGLEAIAANDTAGSAQDLAQHPDARTAVIASRLAGELYDLEVIERDVADDTYNFTRFFVVGLDDSPHDDRSQKTSVVFATRHKPAALYDCLGAFARNHVNLTKLESRSRRSHPWQYWFYLDFEGHAEDPACERALTGLLRSASFVKLLGSYPAAPLPDHRTPSTNALHDVPLPNPNHDQQKEDPVS